MNEVRDDVGGSWRAPELDRRRLLIGSAAVAALAALGGCTPARKDPFTLGVASGDPASDAVVLWTRLATDPLAADGLGGMGDATTVVQWQVAEDERFARVARAGSIEASARYGHSVHVVTDGLAPGRDYFYRFRANGFLSAVGRTRTAPVATALTPCTLAAVSCANYETGLFTAYRRLAEDAPDLVVALGDYIYEYGARPVGNGVVRSHVGGAATTLGAYRQRYAQYHADPDLQAAHAAAPWSCVPDDHEVADNYAGMIPSHPDPGFPARRAAAYRAYWENMPLRSAALPTSGNFGLYRSVRWGSLVDLHLLDTRQYRDDQACGDGFQTGCAARNDPRRTILGAAQQAWLRDGLARSTATWNVLANQVMFARMDRNPGPELTLSMDTWDGYAAERARVLAMLDAGSAVGPLNPVVLTGDIHRHYANDLYRNFDDLTPGPLGVELVTTSISANGDGTDTTPLTDLQLQLNPHVRFANSQRGYVLTRFDQGQAQAQFRVVPFVSRPGATVTTRAAFTVEAGRSGLHRTV